MTTLSLGPDDPVGLDPLHGFGGGVGQIGRAWGGLRPGCGLIGHAVGSP